MRIPTSGHGLPADGPQAKSPGLYGTYITFLPGFSCHPGGGAGGGGAQTGSVEIHQQRGAVRPPAGRLAATFPDFPVPAVPRIAPQNVTQGNLFRIRRY